MFEKIKGESEEDRLDREFLFKHKCFGSIEFVGELYKQGLIAEIVLTWVFEGLLGIGTDYQNVENDTTIEAALILMDKLGSTMENKVSLQKDENKVSAQQNLKKIFDKFKYLEYE